MVTIEERVIVVRVVGDVSVPALVRLWKLRASVAELADELLVLAEELLVLADVESV